MNLGRISVIYFELCDIYVVRMNMIALFLTLFLGHLSVSSGHGISIVGWLRFVGGYLIILGMSIVGL